MTAETWQIGLSGFEQITFYNFIDLIMTLANAVETLTNNCIIEITANEKRCKELLNASVKRFFVHTLNIKRLQIWQRNL